MIIFAALIITIPLYLILGEMHCQTEYIEKAYQLNKESHNLHKLQYKNEEKYLTSKRSLDNDR